MKNRKANILFIIICLFNCSFQIDLANTSRPKFLYKKIVKESCEGTCQHIEIKRKPVPDTGFHIVSIDDREIIGMQNYSVDDQIHLLADYLIFKGDTAKSNKAYKFESAMGMRKPDNKETFTIEVEALYSFTRFFTVGYPPIRPRLLDRITGNEINLNRKKMDEVYEIYRKWYERQKASRFRKIIDLPLDGSCYKWESEGTSKLILLDSLQEQ